jgi:hypothetical protein
MTRFLEWISQNFVQQANMQYVWQCKRHWISSTKFHWKVCVWFICRFQNAMLYGKWFIKSLLNIQTALIICGLFICDFLYIQLRNGLFSGTYPLISMFIITINTLQLILTVWILGCKIGNFFKLKQLNLPGGHTLWRMREY